jgi:hypothetical protein
MPWKASQAKAHTKKVGKSKVAARQWSDVANSMLSRGSSEASAIRGANSVIKKRVAKGKTKK